jgi:ADP-heptose:LPS heptosyltransferase
MASIERPMNQWKAICHYLLKHEECKDVHKLVWEEAGVAFINIGTRHKIDASWTVDRVKEFIQELKRFDEYENLEQQRRVFRVKRKTSYRTDRRTHQ